MASSTTVIGENSVVVGRIAGEGDLVIDGRVEGEIDVTGDITVGNTGMVGASLGARNLTISGAVRGDLVARESIRLEDGARVVGDVKAPRISIAQGALVRGFVSTGPKGESEARTTRTPVKAATPVARPAVAPAVKRPAAVPAPVAQKVAPAPATKPTPAKPAPAKPAPVAQKVSRGAPAPVVPVLRKGTKATQKKRA
jgi:cytoskeletal protein CcmA (bactofilin family)